MTVARINANAVKDDLRAMGLTMEKVSLAMGFSKNYLSTVLARGVVDGATIERVERALFKEPGAYVLQKAESEQPQEEPKENSDETMRALLAATLNNAKEIRELYDLMKELLTGIKGEASTTKEYARRIHDNTYKLTQLWGEK